MTKKNLWKSYTQDDYVKLEQVNNAYKQYLNFGKTERECITATIQLAQKAGYRDLQEIIKGKEPLKCILYVWRKQLCYFRLEKKILKLVSIF